MTIPQALRGLGVKWIRTVDSYRIAEVMATLREALTTRARRAQGHHRQGRVHARAPAPRAAPARAQLAAAGQEVVQPRFGVDPDVCTGDHSCMRLNGCPSLTLRENPDPLREDPIAHVDDTCVGCGVCGEVAHAAVLCPSFYEVKVITNPTRWTRFVIAAFALGRHPPARRRQPDVSRSRPAPEPPDPGRRRAGGRRAPGVDRRRRHGRRLSGPRHVDPRRRAADRLDERTTSSSPPSATAPRTLRSSRSTRCRARSTSSSRPSSSRSGARSSSGSRLRRGRRSSPAPTGSTRSTRRSRPDAAIYPIERLHDGGARLLALARRLRRARAGPRARHVRPTPCSSAPSRARGALPAQRRRVPARRSSQGRPGGRPTSRGFEAGFAAAARGAAATPPRLLPHQLRPHQRRVWTWRGWRRASRASCAPSLRRGARASRRLPGPRLRRTVPASVCGRSSGAATSSSLEPSPATSRCG